MSRLVPALGSVALVSAVVVACGNSDDDDNTTPPPATDAGGDSSNGTSTQCATPAVGDLPGATCDFSYDVTAKVDNCSSATGTCAQTSSASCNTSSACLALDTNAGSTTDTFRMRALYLAAPEALTTGAVQTGIVNAGMELTNPGCGQNGNALFNWLFTIDTATNMLTTGGAPAPSDATGASGFCYENDTQDGLVVEPVNAPLTKNADGTYSTTTPIDTFNIPIVSPDKSVIVLPLHSMSIENIGLSDNGDCIGSYKTTPTTTNGGTATCQDIDSCQRWSTAAALGGYITLAEADKVQVEQLGETLCALLSVYQPNTKDPSTMECAKDSSGNYIAKGDWCSTSNTAATATCADAYWLSATFAASAAKVSATCP